MDRGRFRSGHAYVLLPRSPRGHPFLYDVAMRSPHMAALRFALCDALIGLAVACAVVALMLFAAFNSTFIYRGF